VEEGQRSSRWSRSRSGYFSRAPMSGQAFQFAMLVESLFVRGAGWRAQKIVLTVELLGELLGDCLAISPATTFSRPPPLLPGGGGGAPPTTTPHTECEQPPANLAQSPPELPSPLPIPRPLLLSSPALKSCAQASLPPLPLVLSSCPFEYAACPVCLFPVVLLVLLVLLSSWRQSKKTRSTT
jgi:hypothetical protein